MRPVRCAADSGDPGVSVGRATLAGLCASLAGIGLARFAYTALMPALVAEQWFPASQAAYLGAANLAGYLAGALAAPRIAGAAPVAVVLRAMMLLATASFFACAQPLSFAWFFVWRFAAGVSGGALMVLAALAVLPYVPASRRGLAAGVIFTGVGLGIIMSGTLVPLLFRFGLGATWEGLGLLSLLVTVLAWGGWPKAATPPVPDPQRHNRSVGFQRGSARALCRVRAQRRRARAPHDLPGRFHRPRARAGPRSRCALLGGFRPRRRRRADPRWASRRPRRVPGRAASGVPGAGSGDRAGRADGPPGRPDRLKRDRRGRRSWRGAARARPSPGIGREATAAARRLGACARPPSPWARRLQPMSSPACSNGAMVGICRCLRPGQGRCCWRSRSIWSGRGRRGCQTER